MDRIQRPEEGTETVVLDGGCIFLISIFILPGFRGKLQEPSDKKQLGRSQRASDLEAAEVPSQVTETGEGQTAFGIDSPECVGGFALQR